jgi:hypothetical protein
VATFTVTLEYPTGTQTVTVHYSSLDGTAVSSGPASKRDFDAIADGVLTFEPGTTTRTISVTVREGATTGQNTNTANEFFSVVLNSATNATIGDSTGVGTFNP